MVIYQDYSHRLKFELDASDSSRVKVLVFLAYSSLLCCFQKEETSQKVVHHGGVMIANVNVMVHHQAVKRSVIRNVIGVVVVIVEMTVSVTIVSVMSAPVTIVPAMSVCVTIVPVMTASVTQVQVRSSSQNISAVTSKLSLRYPGIGKDIGYENLESYQLGMLFDMKVMSGNR